MFTLTEAQQLLPVLKQLLIDANSDLVERLEIVRVANEQYEKSEARLSELDVAESFDELRNARADFQQAIQDLSNAQNTYVSRLNYWIDSISSHGVILRDLREGLLDFPAEQQGFQYLMCWRMDEPDITTWHLENDGFIGRKPLAALSEYY